MITEMIKIAHQQGVINIRNIRYIMIWLSREMWLQVPKGVDGWGVTLKGIMSIVVIFGLLICALRVYVEKTTVQSRTADLPEGGRCASLCFC